MTSRSLASYIEAHGISVEIEEGPNWDVESYADGRPGWEHHAYTLKLINEDEGTEMTSNWRTGIGITASPDDEPETVLDALISDAWGYENARSFEDWCGEYGYDTDSIKALRTWEACEKVSNDLIDFLGGKPELEKLALKFERL